MSFIFKLKKKRIRDPCIYLKYTIMRVSLNYQLGGLYHTEGDGL